MIGPRTRFRENDDLPPWRGPATKKKPPFFNARALITLCTVGMRNAILGNHLKEAFETVASMNDKLKRTEFDGAFCKKFKLLVDRFSSFFR